MRDDRHKWAALADREVHLELSGAALTSVTGLRQTLVSGPNVHSQFDLPIIGWPDVAPKGPYALSLRRDRLLLVNGPKMTVGWDAENSRAVSDASDLYAVLEMSGRQVMDYLCRGTEISLQIPSKSVMRRLFGVDVAIYSFEEMDCVRLHVESARCQSLIEHLRSASSLVAD